MKKILSFSLLLLISIGSYAQENIFWDGDFWNAKTSVEDVKKEIKNGNDPIQGNAGGFDATTYAILNHAPIETVKYLLSLEGNDVNKLTHDERTYLFWAANRENLPLVTYLFQKGAKADVYDNRLYSPIMFAARGGITNAKLYDVLIKNGVDVTYANPKGINVLLVLAGSVENLQNLDYFTKKGLSLKHTDKQGKNMIDYAAATGNQKLIEQLIKKGLSYKDTNKDKTNALLMAAQPTRGEGNSLEFFTHLVDLKINPKQIDEEGKNIYHLVARNNKQKNVLSLFTDFNIDVNALDKDKNTPLMYAASKNTLENVHWLAQRTKNINQQNAAGQTALSLAVEQNKAEVVTYLLDHKAEAQIKDAKGNNLAAYLIQGYSKRNAEEFHKKWEVLDAAKVDFTATQENGNTLFHYAAEKEDLGLFKRIKEAGVNINAQNEEGLSVLHKTALTAKDTKLMRALIVMGADKNLKTEFEESAYDLAQENELLDANEIKFLK
ncbi:ankyrin repeat domain-containing protein [Mesonia ostreae]|uniref:Ankyrin repeat domain-containing protein n=1 Tax=Mesonia ostreae TaxID=861110 RepID=A0ABU2KIE4_9FLAO|nr:ankyrin repeat domain-containing protein [Mesonia ostreae]MDT0294449.1 ankyrin repeat domain-containing protein [Mesonia ostreae]